MHADSLDFLLALASVFAGAGFVFRLLTHNVKMKKRRFHD